MAENITVVMSKGDLQPLANNIKTLNGLSQSDLVTLNEMEKAVEDTNDAIDSQENLIAQISAALEGKTAGGGGGSIETCTVTISGSSSGERPYYISYMTNEDVPAKVITNNSNLSVTLQNVLCGSVVTVSFYSSEGNSLMAGATNAVCIATRGYNFIAFRITAPSGGTATITNTSSGGSIN